MARGRKPIKSVAKAEERAYHGDNESQDSQFVLDQMQALYGIGQQQTTPAVNASNVSTSRPQSPPPPPPVNRATVIATQALHHFERQESTTTATNPCQLRSVVGSDIAAVDHASLPQLRPNPALKKKMEDGSQSPTQSNEGRSYEQYREIGGRDFSSSQFKPTDPDDRYESQRSHADSEHEHRTLHEDETGAVNFDLGQFGPVTAGRANDFNDADTESGSEDGRGDDSSVAPVSQPRLSSGFLPPPFVRNSSNGMPPPPETPNLATRLFQASNATMPLMPSSQLFANTQFTSGVKKVASPTSSRPSPEINQNTISPNPHLISSPLRERGLRTSPLQTVRSSSPSVPPPSSRPTPTNPDPYDAPESPHVKAPRTRPVPEPIRDYVPSRSSPIERHTSVEIIDESGAGDSDSDPDHELRKRQRRAKQKQEQATRSLRSITFSRPSSRSEELVEVPSTNQKKPASRSADQKKYGDAEAQETVADSQDAGTKTTEDAKNSVPQEKAAFSSAAPETGISSSDRPLLPRLSTVNVPGSRDLIPETSPAGTAAEPKGPTPPILSNESTEVASTPSLPPRKKLRRSAVEEPNEIIMNEPGDQPKTTQSSSPMPSTDPPPTSQTSRRSGRPQDVATPQLVVSSSAPHSVDPGTRSSSLTALSATPGVSSSTTPNTEDGEEPPKNTSSSPAAAKVQRQSRPRSTLKTYTTPARQRGQRGQRGGARKETSRLTRQSSVSTDELARDSTSPASFLDQKRSSRSFRSVKETILKSPSGMFSGMIFVTTIASSDNGNARKTEAQKKIEAEKEAKKEEKKEEVEALIRKAGGQIINDGFHDLFEMKSSVVPEASSRTLASRLSLTPEAANAGFTALLTDNCSRKAKYMQALALGLPCLSWNWVAACIAKGSLVDWLPYMLCAGPSTVLDGAFKSRDLPKYEASCAKLPLIISQRPMLLGEMSVLLVVKKTKAQTYEKRCTFYAFLAHVLGADLERVNTSEEAGEKLREREETGRPFDWVYPDGDDAIFNILMVDPPAQVSNNKKRKRQSTTNRRSIGPPLRSKPRILTDELIIQSLILGRLVEEGEMQ